MADNINVTQGAGTVIATDDVGGVHYQKVREQLGPDGTAPATIKDAKITASASGSTSVVAAVASKKIRVISYVLSANAAVNAKFQSNGTTDITGLLYMDVKGGAVVGYNPHGWFETNAGEPLTINLSAAVAVGGHLSYVEV